jgi:putative membrane protein
LTPIIVMLVAYPLLALDQISVELQNPFSLSRVSHLPLDDICRTIQSNLLALLDEETNKDLTTTEPPRAKIAV